MLGVGAVAVLAAVAVPVVRSARRQAKLSAALSLAEFRAIAPQLAEDKAIGYLPFLNAAMEEAEILETPARMAAFLAQLLFESGQFRYMEEIASGEAYEGRKDLGNTEPGDGKRYKGRGPIQLTGRFNYRAAGKALGLPLEEDPTRVATPGIGFRTSAWYWTSRNLNELADAGDFVGVTRAINGGTNGLQQRQTYFAKAKAVLAERETA